MGRCSRCGGPAPGDIQGEICPLCRQKMQAEEYEKQKKINTSRSSTGNKPSANSWQTNARTHKSGSGIRTLIIIVIVIIAAFLGIRYWNYTSFENNLTREFTIDKEISGDSSSFINGIANRKDNYAQWSLSITKMPDDYISSVFNFISEKTVRIKHWAEDGVDSYYYYFYTGFDMGTGLEGKYYLTEIDGKKCIISKRDETVYQEGSAFFGEHYEQLMAMTYDAVIPELTNKLIGSEYGTNEDFNTTVFKNDSVFASIEKESNYTTIVDESNNERWRYVLQYSENASESVPDISEYKAVSE